LNSSSSSWNVHRHTDEVVVPAKDAQSTWQIGDRARPGMVAVFLLAQFKGKQLPWSYGRYALNHLHLRSVAGLKFYKHLGSGYEGGFGLRPSFHRQALFLVFESQHAAVNFVTNGDLVQAYAQRTTELFTVLLHPYASKGRWSGFELAPTCSTPPHNHPIATLTRASILPSKVSAFWNDAKPAHDAIVEAPGCLLSAGVGEVPIVRQATFSIWQSVQTMNDYARTGAHLAAIRRSYDQSYFSESMFVRFVVERPMGQYKGRLFDGSLSLAS
jgi:hypothetical protein